MEHTQQPDGPTERAEHGSAPDRALVSPADGRRPAASRRFDVVDHAAADHRQLLRDLEAVCRSEPDDVDPRSFADRLLRHEALERCLVHPHVERQQPGRVIERRIDQDAMNWVLERSFDGSEPRPAPDWHRLRRLLRRHIVREEREIHPALRRCQTRPARIALADRWRTVERSLAAVQAARAEGVGLEELAAVTGLFLQRQPDRGRTRPSAEPAGTRRREAR